MIRQKYLRHSFLNNKLLIILNITSYRSLHYTYSTCQGRSLRMRLTDNTTQSYFTYIPYSTVIDHCMTHKMTPAVLCQQAKQLKYILNSPRVLSFKRKLQYMCARLIQRK